MPVAKPNAPVAPAKQVVSPVSENEVGPDGQPIKPKRIQKRTPRAVWGERNAEGEMVTPIADGTQPEGYDRKKFLPLHKADFANSADFTEWLACQFEIKAAALHKKAVDERTLGSVGDRAKAKKLRSLKDKLAALEKELREQGLDVDALLAD